MRRKLVILSLILVLVALPLAACAQPAAAPAPEKVTLIFYGGAPGGTAYPIAVAMIKVWEDNIPGLRVALGPTGGGVASVEAIEKDIAQIAVGLGQTVGEAMVGGQPFEEKAAKIRGFVYLFPLIFSTVVWKDSPIMTFADLKGTDFNPSVKGYSSEVLIQRVLELVDLSYEDMGSVQFAFEKEAAALLKDGHIDAMVDYGAGEADPTLMELSLLRPIRILDIPDDMLAKLHEKEPGVIRYTIPAGSLNGLDKDALTVASGFGFIITSDLSEDLVYNMTKSLAENWGDVKPSHNKLETVEPQDFTVNLGAELHPGALKYYQEQGWIK
jgi:TRAP transporter TAXI family solute receptor